jgi:hypothetical protein
VGLDCSFGAYLTERYLSDIPKTQLLLPMPLGGSYVFADTDSMAIVASRTGRLVPCPGGPHSLPDGKPAGRGLSWAEVDTIVAKFEALNPNPTKGSGVKTQN